PHPAPPRRPDPPPPPPPRDPRRTCRGDTHRRQRGAPGSAAPGHPRRRDGAAFLRRPRAAWPADDLTRFDRRIPASGPLTPAAPPARSGRVVGAERCASARRRPWSFFRQLARVPEAGLDEPGRSAWNTAPNPAGPFAPTLQRLVSEARGA